MHGFHGRYLRIDVSTGRCEWKALRPDVLRRFIGGSGLSAWLLHCEARVGVEPLAPEAPLIFCFSPLVGTPLTTSAKFTVAGKSPLTGRFNDSLSSSHFAIDGKKTGADALVVTGAAEAPSILVIDNGNVKLIPASRFWGLSTRAAAHQLCDELGPEYRCAVIGPAGEKLVRYATISHEHRHAGRGGLGAVMGAKKIKAIAVRGMQRCSLADPASVVAAARELSRRSMGPATAKYRELGTVSNLLTFNRLNTLPTRNFQYGSFDAASAIGGEILQQERQVARDSCAACTIGCEHIFAAPGGQVRLEYESLFALGSLCGIGDRDIVLEAARRCDELGLDTISTGATIAFAMECSERGLLAEGRLEFGRGDQLLHAIDQISQREGIGDLLAEGTRRTAEMIGGRSSDFAPHVKGLEIPGYEPRSLQTMALGFAVNSRGADHNRSGAYEADFSAQADRFHGSPESARFAIASEDRAALIDSLILCKFLRGVFRDLYSESAELLNLVTGWDMTADELRTTAQRIVTAKKLFNLREGWTPTEDMLPNRFFSERLPPAAAPGAFLPRDRFEQMVRAYYRERGWTDDGYVPHDAIEQLSLSELASDNAAQAVHHGT